MNNTAQTGIGFGTALAIVVSYTINQHIGWAIVHGICSWFYVLYVACGNGR